MSFRNISAWSIRNPVVPIILFAMLLLAGVVSFVRMDVNNNPDIDFPAVTVNVVQPGASPTEISTQITQKIEAAVRSINGVDEIQSSAREGSSNTFVQFEIGIDPNDAVNDVTNAIDQVRSDLPDGILEPRVSKVEIGGGGPIAYYAVKAEDMTLEQLSWFVDDTVSRRLLSIEGMASVRRIGGVDREISVVLDPVRMQSLGVTAAQINQVLRQLNIDVGGGEAEIAGSRQSVRVLGNAPDAYALGETQINLPGGRVIRLKDVADVSDGASEVRQMSKFNGRRSINIAFERAKGASDVTVYDASVKEFAALQEENPNVEFIELFTQVDYTKSQFISSMEMLIEGALLAIIVVFLFLRDWRATIISAIAIPLSAIPTFLFMDLLGFTLNTMSLLALSLVAGVLVDDAIVEIENIVRHMRMGKTAYQASIDAADEIGLAVVATSLSIVAVFLPVGLMPGLAGQFFKAFGLTVVSAVLISLAVARMITPMIAAYFLKAHGHAEHGEGPLMDRYMRLLAFTLDSSKAEAEMAKPSSMLSFFVPAILFTVFAFLVTLLAQAIIGEFEIGFLTESVIGGDAFWIVRVLLVSLAAGAAAFVLISAVIYLVGSAIGRMRGLSGEAMFSGLKRFGHATFARLKDHRIWAFFVGLFALALTAVLIANLPQQFQPTLDEDISQVNIEMVPGSTLEQTEAISAQIAARLRQEPEVQHMVESIRVDEATHYVRLRDDRDVTSSQFEKRLTPVLAGIADARVSFAAQGGGGFGTGRDISIMLTGSDPELLEETAQVLVSEMAELDSLVAPRVAADLQRPELIVEPRFDLAARLGVTTTALSQTIRIATIGEIEQNAAKFSLSDRQVPIRVMLPKSARQDITAIENLPVPTADGGSVPLSRVAEIRFGAGPTVIQRYNQSRRVLVGADLAPDQVLGVVTEQVNQLPVLQNLPMGISRQPVGDEKWLLELVESFAIAVITGIFLVFAVLVLLYRRFVSPLVNMTSLLLAPLGGVLALIIWGTLKESQSASMSMPVYIGMLMLLGIVAKNSILLIDFTIEAMDRGVPKKEAILDAGHKRAQPIVMTTVAMAAGMVPTALSLSGDGAWRAPMGVTVIGGLILSTVLTLVIVPAGFSLADGFEKRVGPLLRNWFLTYRPGDEDRPHDPDRGKVVPAE